MTMRSGGGEDNEGEGVGGEDKRGEGSDLLDDEAREHPLPVSKCECAPERIVVGGGGGGEAGLAKVEAELDVEDEMGGVITIGFRGCCG